jgi:hypothetical protein
MWIEIQLRRGVVYSLSEPRASWKGEGGESASSNDELSNESQYLIYCAPEIKKPNACIGSVQFSDGDVFMDDLPSECIINPATHWTS